MGSTGFSWTLPDHPKLPKGKPVAVVVLDGWGEANPDEYNCIHVAQTPVMDSLKNGAPEKWRLVKAHGMAVGLPSMMTWATVKLATMLLVLAAFSPKALSLSIKLLPLEKFMKEMGSTTSRSLLKMLLFTLLGC